MTLDWDSLSARIALVPGVTGESVAHAARAAGGVVDYVPHRADLAAFVAGRARPGDVVLVLGAGDVAAVPDELVALLEAGS